MKHWWSPSWGQCGLQCRERVCQRCPSWQCGWWQQKWPANGSSWLHSSGDDLEPSRPKSVLDCHTALMQACWNEDQVFWEKARRWPRVLEICWSDMIPGKAMCVKSFLAYLSASWLFCRSWHETGSRWRYYQSSGQEEAPGTGKATKSAQRAQGCMSITPSTCRPSLYQWCLSQLAI